MINNVVLVLGVQQSDLVIHMCIYICVCVCVCVCVCMSVSIVFQILFPFRLLQNIEQSTLGYTVGPCWLSILNMVVYTCQPQTPNIFFYKGKINDNFCHNWMLKS